MTLTCPTCAAAIEVNDSALNKLMPCPKCQSKFVANESHRAVDKAAAVKAPRAAAAVDQQYAMDGDSFSAKKEPPAYTQWKACPNCGAGWRPGDESCAKCHFNGRLNRVIKPDRSSLFSFRFDLQKLYLWIALAAAGAAVYWLLMNFHKVRAWVNSLWPSY